MLGLTAYKNVLGAESAERFCGSISLERRAISASSVSHSRQNICVRLSDKQIENGLELDYIFGKP